MDKTSNSTSAHIFDANGEPVSCGTVTSGAGSSGELHQQLFDRFRPSAYISGVGHCLPPTVVSNADLASNFGLRFRNAEAASPGEFSSTVFDKTGILSRHHALQGPTLAELAVAAAQQALRMAGLHSEQVTHVVFGATFLGAAEEDVAQQIRSGLNMQSGNGQSCNVEILLHACASSGFCIERALEILRTQPEAEHVIVIGADKGSSFINFSDTGTAILFGDGAGALIVSRRHDGGLASSGILLTTSGLFPQYNDYIFLNGEGKIEMPNGTGVFREACSAVKASINELLQVAGLAAEQVDRLVLHQANTRLPAYIAGTFKLPPAKVLTNIRHRGNTCAASPLILASEAAEIGLLQRGDLVVLAAVGMGMKSSAVLLYW